MLAFKTLVLWIHLTGIVLWIGGLCFYGLVFISMFGKGNTLPPGVPSLLARVLHRFIRYSKEIVGAIILSGVFNIINSGYGIGFQFSTTYLSLLAGKILFFLIILGIQIWFSIRLAPALAKLSENSEADNLPHFRRLRGKIIGSTVGALILFFAAMFIGLYLRYV